VNQKLISLGAGAAAVGAIAVASLVFVGNGQDTTVSALELSDAQVSQIQADLANTPTADQAAYLQKLAGKLGVSVDALTAAIKATNLEILDEKVASGDLTQEQADAARTRIENGDGPLFGIGGPRGHGPGHGPGDDEAVAGFLGVDEATFEAEEQAGKSLATIAADHGKSRDELKAFLTAEEKTELAQAVTDGKLTQAQADEHLAQFTANLDERIDSVRTDKADGPRGGFRGGPPASGAPAPSSGSSTTIN
jgi:hypothetical protein